MTGRAARGDAQATARIKQAALALGCSAVGIASLEPDAHGGALDRWLAEGFAGTMTYLHRQAAKRKDPARIMEGAAAAVVTLTDYWHGTAGPDAAAASAVRGRVAQYAWSRDYHRVLGERHERLAGTIRELFPEARTRMYVDAGPVPERGLARRAGLGWIAKNTMLIHPQLGSYTVIGTVFTTAPLVPDLPFAADRCGSCTRCLDACPTEALVAPALLDARRCISYLTIEHRGGFSEDEREMVGDWAFGCDVCQAVCPWNERFARATPDPGLAPRPDLQAFDLEALLALDEAGFQARFGDTPLERPGLEGMRRNAAAVLANRAAAR